MKRYRLTESRLRNIIRESIRQIINENEMDGYETYTFEAHDPTWTIPIEYTCEFNPNGQICVYSSLYGKGSNVYTILSKTYNDYIVNGKLDTRKLELDAEREFEEEVDSLF